MPKLQGDQVTTVETAERGFLRPSGWYIATLADVSDEGPGKSGHNYWKWTFEKFILQMAEPQLDLKEIEGDNGPGKEFGGKQWHNTSLSPESAWKLNEAFAAFNAPPDTDTDELIGKQCAVHLGQEVQQQGKGTGTIRNVVAELAPLDVLSPAGAAANGSSSFDF